MYVNMCMSIYVCAHMRTYELCVYEYVYELTYASTRSGIVYEWQDTYPHALVYTCG